MTDISGKLQLVAFTTNENEEMPNDIISIFLPFYSHKILKKGKAAMAFNFEFPESNAQTKIMICSILDLTREYLGINDVNCYIIMVGLGKEGAGERFDNILKYMKEYCDDTKLIYILGLTSNSDEGKVHITQEEITNKMDNFGQKYEYRNVNINQEKEVAECILQILTYSQEHDINAEEAAPENKDDGQSHSCVII